MSKGRFAVIVEFELVPGGAPAFLDLVNQNAEASVTLEPGCTRFDVLTADRPERVVLYEIYSDAAAFDAHVRTAHFRDFDAATAGLVVSKAVSRLEAETHGKGTLP